MVSLETIKAALERDLAAAAGGAVPPVATPEESVGPAPAEPIQIPPRLGDMPAPSKSEQIRAALEMDVLRLEREGPQRGAFRRLAAGTGESFLGLPGTIAEGVGIATGSETLQGVGEALQPDFVRPSEEGIIANAGRVLGSGAGFGGIAKGGANLGIRMATRGGPATAKALTKAATRGATAATFAAGWPAAIPEAFYTAKAGGADDETAWLSALVSGAGQGALEVLGPERFIGRLAGAAARADKATGGAGKEILLGIVGEGGEEAGQSLWADMVVQDMFDAAPDEDWGKRFAKAAEQAAYGGFGGGMMTTFALAADRYTRKQGGEQETPEPDSPQPVYSPLERDATPEESAALERWKADRKATRAEFVERPEAEEAVALARKTGATVLFVDDDAAGDAAIEGMEVGRNLIILPAKADPATALLATATHESVHTLPEGPRAKLVDDLTAVFPKEAKALAERYKARAADAGKKVGGETLKEESAADLAKALAPVVRRVMTDRATAVRVMGQRPGLMIRVLDTVRGAFGATKIADRMQKELDTLAEVRDEIAAGIDPRKRIAAAIRIVKAYDGIKAEMSVPIRIRQKQEAVKQAQNAERGLMVVPQADQPAKPSKATMKGDKTAGLNAQVADENAPYRPGAVQLGDTKKVADELRKMEIPELQAKAKEAQENQDYEERVALSEAQFSPAEQKAYKAARSAARSAQRSLDMARTEREVADARENVLFASKRLAKYESRLTTQQRERLRSTPDPEVYERAIEAKKSGLEVKYGDLPEVSAREQELLDEEQRGLERAVPSVRYSLTSPERENAREAAMALEGELGSELNVYLTPDNQVVVEDETGHYQFHPNKIDKIIAASNAGFDPWEAWLKIRNKAHREFGPDLGVKRGGDEDGEGFSSFDRLIQSFEQIKSATGNLGTFSPESADIRYSLAQTSTPEFKRWFGDSKVVDGEGKPLVVYHSGLFDENEDGVPIVGEQGMHFGSKAAAMDRDAGKPVDDFISGATYDQDENGRWHWSSEGVESFDFSEEGFASRESARKNLENFARESDSGDREPMPMTEAYLSLQNVKRVKDQKDDWSTAIKQAKAEGYDGLVYRNEFEGRGSDSYVAFAPTQVKSTGNLGTFSPESADIRYSLAQTSTPEFKRWFGDSKVVDGEGKPLVVYHGTNSDFNEFAQSKIGEFGPGIYLTSSANEANTYAGGRGRGEEGASIKPVYVQMRNPYRATSPSQVWEAFPVDNDADLQVAMQEAGYDGIELTRPVSTVVGDQVVDTDEQQKHYVVWKPTQIKSATGNLGTFDPENPDIRYSIRSDIEKEVQKVAQGLGREGYQLANAGTTLPERGLRAAVRSMMAPEYVPDTETEARVQRILNDPQARTDVLAAGISGEPLNTEQTVALDRMARAQAANAWIAGSEEDMGMAQATEVAYQQQRTEQARSLGTGLLRDSMQTPMERAMKLLLTPSRKVQRKLAKAETWQARRAILREEAKKVMQVRYALAERGFDPRLITDDYFKDPEFRSTWARAVADAKGGSPADWYISWRRASMLSAPITAIRNLSGNAAYTGYDRVLRLAADSIVPGSKTETGDVAEYVKVLLATFPEAWSNARDAYRDFYVKGTEGTSLDDKANLQGGKIRTAVESVGIRVNVGTDAFFKTILGAAEIRLRSRQMARAKGGVAEDYEHDPDVLKLAKADMERALFLDRDKLTRAIVLARDWADEAFAGIPVGSTIVPFASTPTQLVRRSGEALLGPAAALWRKEEKGGTALLGLATWAAMIWAASLFDDDDGMPILTGSSVWGGEGEFQGRTAPAYSMRIGGSYYSYKQIQPLSMALASIVDGTRKGTPMESIGSFVKAAKDQSFFQSIETIWDAVQGVAQGERGLNRAGKVARELLWTPMIPNVIRSPVRSTDEVRRKEIGDPFEQRDFAYAALPIAALGPPLKHDLWGRPVQKEGGTWVARVFGAMPMTQAVEHVERVDALLGKFYSTQEKPSYFNAPETYVTRNKQRIDWTEEEYSTLTREAGTRALERIRPWVAEKDTLTKGEVEYIGKVISATRAQVANELLQARNPE